MDPTVVILTEMLTDKNEFTDAGSIYMIEEIFQS